MRHCQSGTQTCKHTDFQDPLAFACPASIVLVLALACQVEDQVYKAEEHLSPLDRCQRRRARGKE
eukprot:3246221-Pyramimonas_sp.AAC.1